MIPLEAMATKLRLLGADIGVEATVPGAAVAAILRQSAGAGADAAGGGASGTGDGAEILFILRAEHPEDPWSGHVAFPGGRRDLEDASLLATAIREVREEVGIELDPDDLLARLPDVPAFTRSKKGTLVVTPFVFALAADVPIHPNAEVAGTLWVPLALLAGERDKATFELVYDGKTYELPFIHIGEAKHRLWGMTYRMIMSLLDALA